MDQFPEKCCLEKSSDDLKRQWINFLKLNCLKKSNDDSTISFLKKKNRIEKISDDCPCELRLFNIEAAYVLLTKRIFTTRTKDNGIASYLLH